MKKWYSNLNIYHRSAFLSVVLSLILFILSIPLIVFNLGDISYGFVLGVVFTSLFYFFIGLGDKYELKNKKTYISITMSILRLVFIILFSFLLGYIYYELNIKIFNVFAFIGGYFFTTVVYLIISIKGKKEQKDNVDNISKPSDN